MSAREAVLGAVRAALGRGHLDRSSIAHEARALLHDMDAVRPALPFQDLVEAFAARVISPKVGATLDQIGVLHEVPRAVQRYLSDQGLPHTLAMQPDPALLSLDWTGFDIRAAAMPDEAAALGLARWGIAETGSLVFHSGPDTAVLNHFLPLHHLAVVHARSILPHLEDYAAVGESAPRNANLITGASGTTDIEGSYVRGAHGPRHLHILLVSD